LKPESLRNVFDFPYCPSSPLECSQRYLQNRIFHRCKPLLTAPLQNSLILRILSRCFDSDCTCLHSSIFPTLCRQHP
jgi:hypothetical protein